MMKHVKGCPNGKEIYKLMGEKNYGFTPNLNLMKLPSVSNVCLLYAVLQESMHL